MLYLYIYIALFVGTLVYAVWDSHTKVKYILFKEGYPTFTYGALLNRIESWTKTIQP